MQTVLAALRDGLADPAADEVDRAQFDEYARTLTIRWFTWLALGIAISAAIWWPVDYIVYAGDSTAIERMADFRLRVMLLDLVLAFLLWRVHLLRIRVRAYTLVAFVLNVMLAAWSMAEVGDGDPLFFSLAYLTPVFAVVFQVPFRIRVMQMSMIVAALIGAWGVHPASDFSTPGATATASYLVFCGAVSVGIGHALFVLVRRSFHLYLQMDRQREALAGLTGHLEQRVAEQTLKLKSLHRRAQDVRAEQRQELSRDLHDGIGQELTSLRLLVAFSKRQPEQLDELLAEFDGQVDRVQESLRRILEALRPQLLDDLGLSEALRVLVGELKRRSGLDITVNISSDFPADLPPRVSVTLYRVCQEALNNTLRHARAQQVRVRLHLDGPTLHLTVEDDGTGTAPDAIGRGLGTAGIIDRVKALRGTVQWSPPPGTTIRVAIPMESAT